MVKNILARNVIGAEGWSPFADDERLQKQR
jgi:hypothetical protein